MSHSSCQNAAKVKHPVAAEEGGNVTSSAAVQALALCITREEGPFTA